MKKRYIVLILLAIFIFIFYFIYKAITEVGQPPTEEYPVENNSNQKSKIITVSYPLPETTISSPSVTIKGSAVGNWFFEATAPVDIVNWDGVTIGQGYVTVDSRYDWMTTSSVPFAGTISYDISKIGVYKYGWIIMKKSNPSGEPKFDDSLKFKVFFP